jgi:hypothetical protein
MVKAAAAPGSSCHAPETFRDLDLERLSPQAPIPLALREIGRLRELAFREAGESG